jgi:hypothetical protein
MSNAAVTSVIARCLLDATFLEHMAADPRAALSECALDERTRFALETLDIAQVRRFAGFIVKVQHSFLWESFPWTVKLLQAYGIELEVFASYLAQHQRLRRSPGLSRREKLAAFAAFLRGLLNEGPGTRWAALLDVLTHEQAEWEIRTALADEPAERPQPCAPLAPDSREFLRQVPVVRGALRIARFSYDPCEIIALLAAGAPIPDRLAPQPCCLAYWGDVATQELRVLELDALSAVLLAQVNGRRSLRTVLRRGCAGLPAVPGLPAVRQLFGALAGRGVLAFASGGA